MTIVNFTIMIVFLSLFLIIVIVGIIYFCKRHRNKIKSSAPDSGNDKKNDNKQYIFPDTGPHIKTKPL